MKRGMVYVYTGDGKGKTSAALGTVLRAIGNKMSVSWVSWYKQKSWKLSELGPLEKLGVKAYLMGEGFNFNNQSSITNDQKVKKKELIDGSMVVDSAGKEKHKESAQKALDKASEFLGSVDVLVLDEVNNAVSEDLIDIIDLIDLIKRRGKTHLILTGRNVSHKVVEIADLVTECKKVKHPYDSGELAIRGLDY